ncbi:MAG: dihydrolipoamide acetyltransferase family protein [Acidimicrobiia bacterium]
MADQVVKMPRLGESVTEGTVTTWFKEVGDTVDFDDMLFEVSTDKVDSEIPSPFEGVILEILVSAGETVDVDTPLVRIGEPGDEPSDGAGAPKASAPLEPAAAEAAAAPDAAATPAKAASAPAAGAPLPVADSSAGADGNGRALLSPIVRRLAADHGIDLAQVSGSGAGGRIRREDVETVIAAGPAPAEIAPAAAATPADAPTAATASPQDDRSEVVGMSRIRVLIAENMSRSMQISPHVWTSVEVDLENVEQVRQKHKDRFREQEGAGLSYLIFISRVVADGLRRFPALNSSVDLETKTQTFHHYVNLGIAVDLDEQGLIVPVVKDADSLNLRGLAKAITAKAKAARARSLGADEISGSTFTITNPGPMGDYASAPIINQPNVAILSTNQVARRPTVVGEFVAIHHMTILGLSYDHRALDGVTASKFMMYVRDALQDRDWEAELQ